MSPALLSKRMKELAHAGVLEVQRKPNGAVEYRLTEAGEELRPLIIDLGNGAQRWMESRLSLKELDPSLLMWDIRRRLNLIIVTRSRYVEVGWEAERVAILRKIESDPFFQKVRGGPVVGLCNQKEVWPVFGYQGEAAIHGGSDH